jgi:predicted RNA-binding Zn ribbon-like protein
MPDADPTTAAAAPSPAGRLPAPPELRLVQEFVNTNRVREAVRTFLSRDRGQPSELEIGLLDDVGRRARLQWSFDADGSVQLKARSPGVVGALGTILSPLLSAALTGSLSRLKTCRNCRWVFYDYSKNRSGTWCAMSLCGSRAKAKRHYRRMREATSSG